MCPSAPSYPAERATTEQPAARREYEAFSWYDRATTTLPAGTAFTEIATFGAHPDRLIVDISAFPVELRLRNRGQAPGAIIRFLTTAQSETLPGADIVEARDPAGAGGQITQTIALYASRHIDVRDNRPGPRRRHAERLTTPEQTHPNPHY